MQPTLLIIVVNCLLYLYTRPINEPTVVFPIRFRYIFTTKVIVE